MERICSFFSSFTSNNNASNTVHKQDDVKAKPYETNLLFSPIRFLINQCSKIKEKTFSLINKKNYYTLHNNFTEVELIKLAAFFVSKRNSKSPNLERMYRTSLLIGILGMNIWKFFIMSQFYQLSSEVYQIISKEDSSEEEFNYIFYQILLNIAHQSSYHFSTNLFCKLMKNSTSASLSSDLTDRYLHDNNFFEGIKSLPNVENTATHAILINEDIPQLADSICLINDRASSLADLLISINGILNSIHILNDKNKIIQNIIYALLYSKVNFLLGQKLKEIDLENRSIKDQLNKRLTSISAFSLQIALKKGNQIERNKIQKLYHRQHQLNLYESILVSLLKGLKITNSIGSFFFFVYLYKVEILNHSIHYSELFKTAAYVDSIGQFIHWEKNNLEQFQNVHNSRKRIESAFEDFENWSYLFEKRDLKISHHSSLSFKGTLLNPNQINKELLQFGDDFILEKGKRYLMKGKPGVGKTTFFRVLAGLNLNVKGGLLSISNNTVITSQVPYLPTTTLLKAILYPKTSEPTDLTRNAIIECFEHLQIKKEITLFLNSDKTKNWHEVLSGGEKQKIEIISAIAKNPDLLILDEPFSNMDNEDKKHCENLIQLKLPNTTILYVDHSQEIEKAQDSNFFDYVLMIKSDNQRTPIVELMKE